MDLLSNIIVGELIGTVFYTIMGVGLMVLSWIVIEAITPLSIRKEIEEEQNVAIAILMAALFISLAIIIAAVILS